MSNNMLSVWKDGEHWFDFPQSNELNVQAMLQRKNVSASCVILPKGMEPKTGKVTVIAPVIKVNKTDQTTKAHKKPIKKTS